MADDDAPALSAETFAALQEFYAEQAKRQEIFDKLQAEDKLKENVLFDENWGKDDYLQNRYVPLSTTNVKPQDDSYDKHSTSPWQETQKITERPHLTGAAKRRKKFWLSHGYTEKEANAWCQRALADFPEYHKIIAREKAGTPQAAQSDRIESNDDGSYHGFTTVKEQRMDFQVKAEPTPKAKKRRYDRTSNEDMNIERNYDEIKDQRIDLQFLATNEREPTPMEKNPRYDRTGSKDVNTERKNDENDQFTSHKDQRPKHPLPIGVFQKQLHFWECLGYTPEEAYARCLRPLADFPEYQNIMASRKSQATQSRIESNEDDSYHQSTTVKDQIDRKFLATNEVEPIPTAKMSKYDRTSNVDDNTERNCDPYDENCPTTSNDDQISKRCGAARKRKHFWVSLGYTEEEANVRCLRPYSDFPECRAFRAGNEARSSPTSKRFRNDNLETNYNHNKVYVPSTPHVKAGKVDWSKSVDISTKKSLPIKVGIIDDNLDITTDRLKLIEEEILRYIDSSTSEPSFTAYTLRTGCLVLTCKNLYTSDWLRDNIGKFKPWEGASLRVIDRSEFPKFILVTMSLPDKVPADILLNRLAVQNDEVGCENWNVMNVKPDDKGQTICCSIDRTSLAALNNASRTLSLGLGTIKVRIINKNYASFRL